MKVVPMATVKKVVPCFLSLLVMLAPAAAVTCDPDASPAEKCPDGQNCPKCGLATCECPVQPPGPTPAAPKNLNCMMAALVRGANHNECTLQPAETHLA